MWNNHAVYLSLSNVLIAELYYTLTKKTNNMTGNDINFYGAF